MTGIRSGKARGLLEVHDYFNIACRDIYPLVERKRAIIIHGIMCVVEYEDTAIHSIKTYNLITQELFPGFPIDIVFTTLAP